MTRKLSHDCSLVKCGDPLCYLPLIAISNHLSVHAFQVGDLRGGAYEECFITGVQFRPGDLSFLNLNPLVACDLYHRVAGYSLQNPVRDRRSRQYAVPDQKDVLSSAFAHPAI